MAVLEKTAFMLMRISMGVVFLLFGIGKLNNDIWAQTMKTMDVFLRLPWDVNYTVATVGIVEIVTGFCLIIGLFTRLFSVVACLQLSMILVLLKFEETRDIGLLGAAVYMALTGSRGWGADDYLAKRKGGPK